MGNYTDLEYEFIERTLALIEQYEGIKHTYSFEQQYNHTLLINCLTGLIVLPKERTISSIPKDRLLSKVREEMGMNLTVINPDIGNLRDLVINLRHAVAHFSIEVKSRTEDFLIDEIIFYNPLKESGYEVVRFESAELLSFIRYFGSWLLANLKSRKPIN